MPELPEVETVRRSLACTLIGSHIDGVEVREPRLRWPLVPSALRQALLGARFTNFRRRGKYLLADLHSAGKAAQVLVVHLGMTGWWGVRTGELWTHDHVVLRLRDGRQLAFNDARRFGSVHVIAAADEAGHRLLAHLGKEPLDAEAFDGAYLHAACRGRNNTIKERLMDAQVVVGVGNIYACEALFRAGIHPRLKAGRLSRPRAAALTACVRATLLDAIALGGTTFRDFRGSDGKPGYFTARLQVYGRAAAPCLSCQRPIRKIVLGGRSTYFCSHCQRR